MLPQVLLTVLVVLSSASFGSVYYYSLAVAGMCQGMLLFFLPAADLMVRKRVRHGPAMGSAAP